MNKIIFKPIITEKTTNLVKKGFYTFAVSKFSSKGKIAGAIENIFKVNVIDIKTIGVRGKIKRSIDKKRSLYKRPDYKKAIVRIKQGQKISLFESVEEKKDSKKKEVRKKEEKSEKRSVKGS